MDDAFFEFARAGLGMELAEMPQAAGGASTEGLAFESTSSGFGTYEFAMQPDLGAGSSQHQAVSTVFHPGAALDMAMSDMTIESLDGVFFSVHSHRLLAKSSNGFGGRISPHAPGPAAEQRHLRLGYSSSVLNILLHIVYDIHMQQFRPPVDEVELAMAAVEAYDMPIQTLAGRDQPLFALVLALAPGNGLACFELAASRRLEPLAVAVSPYLLSISLADLTDESATKIGATYLKRLFFLHLGRAEALKRILQARPGSHQATLDCDIFAQRRLDNAWDLAVGSLTWVPAPGLSNGAITDALHPLGEHIPCDQCRTLLYDRIRDVLVRWSLVKVTI